MDMRLLQIYFEYIHVSLLSSSIVNIVWISERSDVIKFSLERTMFFSFFFLVVTRLALRKRLSMDADAWTKITFGSSSFTKRAQTNVIIHESINET